MLDLHDVMDNGGTTGEAASGVLRPSGAQFTGQAAPAVLFRGIATLVARMSALAGRMHERRRQRKVIRHMHYLPNYLLRDIGLSRSDIQYAARFGCTAHRHKKIAKNGPVS